MKPIALITALLVSGAALAGSDSTIVIKTSAECGSCKKRIENALNFEKGVKKAELLVKTKEATVTFDTEKITAEKIREVIAGVGYDADNVPAQEKAYDKLPKCCKKGGMDKE